MACFLSATLLPLASEGVLIAFLFAGADPLIILIIASLGNTIGGTTNYLIGRLLDQEKLRSKINNPKRYDAFVRYGNRYGIYLGLISWVPIIGDPLILVAGFLRVKFVPLTLFMLLSKTTRYAIIIILAGYSVL